MQVLVDENGTDERGSQHEKNRCLVKKDFEGILVKSKVRCKSHGRPFSQKDIIVYSQQADKI